jgi:1-acyl-sn-glycerol-3-phosphate acyltransferase
MMAQKAPNSPSTAPASLDPGVAPMGLRGIFHNLIGYTFGFYSLPAIVFAFVTSVLCIPFGTTDRYLHWWSKLWIECQMMFFGVRLEADGFDRFDPQKTYVIVANHRSWMDAMAIILALKPIMNFVFIVKRSLLYIPLIGWYWKWAGFIGVDRKAPGKNKNSMRLAGEQVKRKWSVLIFPEGTRSATHGFRRFRRGAVDLARSAEVEILPVAVSGSARLFPRGSPFIRPGRVRVEFLTPIQLDREKPDDVLLSELQLAIAKRYRFTADGSPLEECPEELQRVLFQK